jgi:Peptidase family M23
MQSIQKEDATMTHKNFSRTLVEFSLIIALVTLLGARLFGPTLTGAASAAGPTRSTASGQPAEEALSPLLASVVAAPRPVLGADDRQHLAYEILLTNPASFNKDTFAVTVAKVEAIDPDRDVVVGTLEGSALAEVMLQFRVPVPDPTAKATLGPGEGGVLLMDTSFDEGAHLPRRLVHRFTVAFEPGPRRRLVTHEFHAAATEVVRDRPVVIAPPLRGARWVVINGCCAELNFHRGALVPIEGELRLPERFAIDFMRLDAQGRVFNGPVDQNASYASFGAEIRSVAKGVVVQARDGLPDQTPGAVQPLENPFDLSGNHVIVDIGHGRFAQYSHMKQGSLAGLREGDRVERGQVLGLLGNSGNTSAPHLHFAILTSPSGFSNSSPYTFKSFGSEGTVTNWAEVTDGEPAALSGRHANQLPLNNQLISFDGR